MRLTLLSLVLCTATCAAQGYPQTQSNVPPVTVVQNLPQLEIGRNDLLDISVYDSPELSGTLRVSEDGTIALPMLGQQKMVKAAGLFPAQLAAAISNELEAAQLVRHPQVTVKIAEYQSRTVTVVGAVRHPLSFQAYGQISLLDAIGRADGLSETAGNEILVTSGHAGGGSAASQSVGLTRIVARVKVSDLMGGKSDRDNVMLHGGEEVRIPEEGRVSVLGDVKHPGVFPVKTDDECSLLTLLARSEGVDRNAANVAYIYRSNQAVASNGQPGASRQEVPVELKKILARKSPDVRLEPGDILYIPDNNGRRITLSVLEHLSTVAGGAAAGLAYAH